MKNLNKKGWVRLHRQIEESGLYFLEPFTKAQAWIDMFLNANHKDGIFSVRGNIVRLKRGQLGWSELTMCSRFGWSKNKLRRFLKLLEVEQQIEQQKTFITTIITIKNYDKFQQDDTADDTAKGQQKDSRRYTNKNDKNDKNDKKGRESVPLSKEKTINYLKDLPEQDIQDFTARFVATDAEIKDKAESLLLYCESRGKQYKNYRAFLLNAVKKDFKARAENKYSHI